jgi:hypothetical protein
VLVVSRVGQPGSGLACVAGFIEATQTPDANAVARAFADATVRIFQCGVDDADWHGVVSADMPDVMVHYPAGE